MSERDDRPTDETRWEGEREALARESREGGGPGAVGALDGAAAAGSIGAVSGDKTDSVMPQEGPDPGIGPD
jgi:hypothetical protein